MLRLRVHKMLVGLYLNGFRYCSLTFAVNKVFFISQKYQPHVSIHSKLISCQLYPKHHPKTDANFSDKNFKASRRGSDGKKEKRIPSALSDSICKIS